MKIQINKKNINVLLIFIFLLISATLVLLYENNNLTQQIEERDILIEDIRKQQIKNSNRVDTLIREIEREISFTNGNQIISANELLDIYNERTNELKTLKDSLAYYKAYYSMVQEKYNHRFTVDSTKYSLSNIGLSRDSIESKYNKVYQKMLSSEKERSMLALQKKMYQYGSTKYNIEYTDIKYEYTKDGIANQISYTVNAPKLDSALLLLPHYRKQLKFNPNDSTWTINIKRFF